MIGCDTTIASRLLHDDRLRLVLHDDRSAASLHVDDSLPRDECLRVRNHVLVVCNHVLLVS